MIANPEYPSAAENSVQKSRAGGSDPVRSANRGRKMKSRYMTIQTILRAAYIAVYVVEWLSGFSESWSRGVICGRSPKRHRQQRCCDLIVSSNQRVVIWILPRPFLALFRDGA